MAYKPFIIQTLTIGPRITHSLRGLRNCRRQLERHTKLNASWKARYKASGKFWSLRKEQILAKKLLKFNECND